MVLKRIKCKNCSNLYPMTDFYRESQCDNCGTPLKNSPDWNTHLPVQNYKKSASPQSQPGPPVSKHIRSTSYQKSEAYQIELQIDEPVNSVSDLRLQDFIPPGFEILEHTIKTSLPVEIEFDQTDDGTAVSFIFPNFPEETLVDIKYVVITINDQANSRALMKTLSSQYR